MDCALKSSELMHAFHLSRRTTPLPLQLTAASIAALMSAELRIWAIHCVAYLSSIRPPSQLKDFFGFSAIKYL